MRFAEEVAEERLHAGAGEEGGRVVFEDEGGRGDDFVALGFLKV